MFRPHLFPVKHLLSSLLLALVSLAASLLFQPLALAQQVVQQSTNARSAAENDERVLELGKPIEREMKGGESHAYRIALTTGQFLHVAVDQRGIDVIVTLLGPAGEKLKTVDLIKGAYPEPLSWIAEKSGTYHLEVRAALATAQAGRYEVASEIRQSATPQDRDRLTAEGLLIEANGLENEGSKESWQRAIERREESLVVWRRLGDKFWEAYALHRNGRVLWQLGENQAALKHYEQALTLRRATGNRAGEAATLTNIGILYDEAGERQRALDYFSQGLSLLRAIGDRQGESDLLMFMGNAYSELDEQQKSLESLNQALLLRHAIGDRQGEVGTLHSIGLAYSHLGDNHKALEYYTQELMLERAIGNRQDEAYTLMSIGGMYMSLGEKQKALEYMIQALPLLRAEGNRAAQANTLNNIAVGYTQLGEKQKALEYLNQALPLMRAAGDPRGEIRTLRNIGHTYDWFGEKRKALDYYNQAFPLIRAIGDRQEEATILYAIGLVYSALSERRQAVESFNQALLLLRAVSDRQGEANLLYNLMSQWNDLGKPLLAVFYGKQAVNTYQQLRSNIRSLDKEVQQAYLKSVDHAYRRLADLLISQGRLPEAQQVLAMLKEEEYFDFIRRDSKEASSLNSRAALTPEEAEWEKRYHEVEAQLVTHGKERGELLAKKSRTPEEEQHLTKLEADLTFAQQAFQKFLDQLAIEFGKSEMAKERVFRLQESQGLMEDLRELGSGAVALYTLVGEEKYRVILVTPDVQRAYEYPIKAADLARKVAAFRQVLEDPRSDPRPLAKELYGILIGPVAKDLQAAHAETLMWSLDGVLRYVPMAALYDGEQYMIERYRNEIFTPASNSRLKDVPSAQWSALGLGVSKAQTGFNPLPAVPAELRGIIRDESNASRAQGVLPGKVMLDEAFTETAMRTALRQRYPVVHIASHFAFQPGNETDSFLLLGDGRHLTLADVKNSTNLFGGVELLTLSACDTATGGAGADGREVEGFGVLAQRQGAKAVVASLWSVADASTKLLMENFYRMRNAQVGTTKAEALRQAQLSLLHRSLEPRSGRSAQQRGIGVELQSAGGQMKYAHPYYWAPFILIGNWR